MEELNLVDLECPEPFLKVSAKVMGMRVGEELKIYYKGPRCDEMLVQLMRLANCNIILHEQKDGVFTMVIRKGEEKRNAQIDGLSGC